MNEKQVRESKTTQSAELFWKEQRKDRVKIADWMQKHAEYLQYTYENLVCAINSVDDNSAHIDNEIYWELLDELFFTTVVELMSYEEEFIEEVWDCPRKFDLYGDKELQEEISEALLDKKYGEPDDERY